MPPFWRCRCSRSPTLPWPNACAPTSSSLPRKPPGGAPESIRPLERRAGRTGRRLAVGRFRWRINPLEAAFVTDLRQQGCARGGGLVQRQREYLHRIGQREPARLPADQPLPDFRQPAGEARQGQQARKKTLLVLRVTDLEHRAGIRSRIEQVDPGPLDLGVPEIAAQVALADGVGQVPDGGGAVATRDEQQFKQRPALGEVEGSMQTGGSSTQRI